MNGMGGRNLPIYYGQDDEWYNIVNCQRVIIKFSDKIAIWTIIHFAIFLVSHNIPSFSHCIVRISDYFTINHPKIKCSKHRTSLRTLTKTKQSTRITYSLLIFYALAIVQNEYLYLLTYNLSENSIYVMEISHGTITKIRANKNRIRSENLTISENKMFLYF